jgi:hypothetical protein
MNLAWKKTISASVKGDAMAQQRMMSHAVETSTLSDVLERVLDKGIVIAGDIRVKLVDIELLSIQIRLVICSVDKAKEMGMDWWVNNPIFRREEDRGSLASSLASIEERMARLEASFTKEETRASQFVSPSQNVDVP